MKITLIIISLLLFPVFLYSQDIAGGGVKIIQDPEIDLLVKKHIRINQTREGIPGYRIQIFFDSGANSKNKARTVCDEFQGKYPGTGVYLNFISPNYKVRVGDFRTRLDAFRFLQELQVNFPSAYVVSDQIKLPSID